LNTVARGFVLLAIFGLSAAYLPATERMYCFQNVMKNVAEGGGVVHVNGLTVEVKPIPDPDVPGFMTCQATIRNSDGKTIFNNTDWGMEIDPITGRDVNGDGIPDAVLVSFSGGAHCCSTYHIVSLGENPGLIAEFGDRATASFEDLNGNGKTEILIRDGGFDEGFGLSHPFSPFPLLIVQLDGAKFHDVGSRFWRVYEKEIQRNYAKLKDENLRQFLKSNPTEIHDSQDYLDTEFRILAIVLDYLYAGRPQEAHKMLGKLWPPEYQNGTWEEMARGYCSGLRATLKVEINTICKKD